MTELTSVTQDYLKVIWTTQEWADVKVTTKMLADAEGSLAETVKTLPLAGGAFAAFLVVAPVMDIVTRVTSPFVTVLDASTAVIFRLLRVSREGDSTVTEEELRHVVQEAEEAGVIEGKERELISGIMRLADRQVRGVIAASSIAGVSL